MRRTIVGIAAMAAISFSTLAQSAMDAYTLTPTELRGTARFVSMGGAFTSLGGDLSTLTQNPAGIGIYRHSDIGLGFDISIRSNETTTESDKISVNNTKAFFDNFGYVGVAKLSGTLRNFNWGVGYSRINSFDRRFKGYNASTGTSLSNYVASFTQGIDSKNLLFGEDYNPYIDSSEDWLSVLAYNSLMINNDGSNDSYAGLFQNGTMGDALYEVHEWGYTDEYNIDFGGNVSDLVYWGLGVGIVDMNYQREINYSESMENALVYDKATDGLTSGNAGFNLYNYKSMSGTGANLKFGVIVRPLDFLRIGVAVHTPTWMHLNNVGYGEVTQYNYTPYTSRNTNSGREYTDDYDYNWRLNTPWRFMVGASAVIGSSAIISADYERVAYNDMSMKYEDYSNWGSSYVKDDAMNACIKDYFKAANIFRVGLEYRITPSFSARLGYNYQSETTREAALDGRMAISTAGTDPSYSFNKSVNNICVGIGYRYQAWYIDLAYQHTTRNSKFSAYTSNFAGYEGPTPTAEISTKHNNIVLSTGFRF